MESKSLFSGKTPEEAIETGLRELGISREEAEIEIVEEGKKGGIFGIGAVLAQVKISKKPQFTDGERSVEFLKGLFRLLDIDASPSLKEEDERIVIDLTASSTKGLIGRRGETIDAVQTLAGAVANKGRHDYIRVVVDCENYREDREETLKHVAEKMAAKAVRLGKRVRLEPMNPYERRIIHASLVDNPDVTTKSEGKEPMRFVVITPKNLRTQRSNMNNRDRGDRGDRGGRKFDKRDGRRGPNQKMPRRELPKDGTPQTSGTSFSRNDSGSGFKKGGFSGFFGTYLGNSRDGSDSDGPNGSAPEEE